MANVQKPGSAQRNIPSSELFRTDFRINWAVFFGTDNWQHGDINTGVSSLPETSSLKENDFIVSIWLEWLIDWLIAIGFGTSRSQCT